MFSALSYLIRLLKYVCAQLVLLMYSSIQSASSLYLVMGTQSCVLLKSMESSRNDPIILNWSCMVASLILSILVQSTSYSTISIRSYLVSLMRSSRMEFLPESNCPLLKENSQEFYIEGILMGFPSYFFEDLELYTLELWLLSCWEYKCRFMHCYVLQLNLSHYQQIIRILSSQNSPKSMVSSYLDYMAIVHDGSMMGFQYDQVSNLQI